MTHDIDFVDEVQIRRREEGGRLALRAQQRRQGMDAVLALVLGRPTGHALDGQRVLAAKSAPDSSRVMGHRGYFCDSCGACGL
jgi:hypothetical protein